MSRDRRGDGIQEVVSSILIGSTKIQPSPQQALSSFLSLHQFGYFGRSV